MGTRAALPRALRPGDLIEVVSPASGLLREKMDKAFAWLEAEGYRWRLAPHCLDQADYLAGSDEDRAADLMAAFRDPEVAAVYCSRGGYGCARLFPFLDLDDIAASGKMFLGFSDITTLHLALVRRGMVPIHAPMPLTLSTERESWVYQSLSNVFRGADPLPPQAPGGTTIVGGVAEGILTGGCMCLICDSLGTPNALECGDGILLLEDVDENPHRVDAMLTHLLNSGAAESAAGFVVGEMTGTDARVDQGIGGRPWREIMAERLAPLGKPLIFDYPFGHRKEGMLSLPLGVKVRLDADAGTLTYLEPHTS